MAIWSGALLRIALGTSAAMLCWTVGPEALLDGADGGVPELPHAASSSEPAINPAIVRRRERVVVRPMWSPSVVFGCETRTHGDIGPRQFGHARAAVRRAL